MRVAKPRDWVPIGSPCTYAASAGISAAGRSQQPSPLLATPSPGATSRGTTATRPPTRSRTRPPSSHSPPRPMPTPSRTPRPGSQRCPTTRSPTRAEGSSGHGNGAGASRSRTNPGPAQAVTPGPAGLDTNIGLGLAAAIVPHAVAPKALSSAPVSSGRISAISDGDTVRVTFSDGTDLGRIRLLGINAPELGHDGQSGQCWAAQARDTLSRIVPVGSTVQLVADPTQADRDVYGRLLRYLVQDGLDVQEALLRQGAARPFWPAGAGTRALLYDLALTDAQQRSPTARSLRRSRPGRPTTCAVDTSSSARIQRTGSSSSRYAATCWSRWRQTSTRTARPSWVTNCGSSNWTPQAP